MQSYYLKSEDSLPPSAKFIDPTDSTEYRPKPRESLGNFIHRIEVSRKEKNLPDFLPSDLQELVEVSLSESANNKELAKYFTKKAVAPTMKQMKSLAKTIMASRLTTGGTPDFLRRQERAKACSGCRLHDSHGTTSSAAAAVVGKLIGLQQVNQSPLEKSLGRCRMCGCGMKEKIRAPLVGAVAGLEPEQLTSLLSTYQTKAFEQCWILKESLEDPALAKIIKRKVEHSSPRTSGAYAAYQAEQQRLDKIDGD